MDYIKHRYVNKGKAVPMKAHGKIFDKWTRVIDYVHLTFELDLESTEKFDKSFGDISNLESFIQDCQSGTFINYDGHASEILLDEKVVYNKTLYPSDIDFYAKKLRELNAKHDNKLEIVWYNR